MRMLEIKLFEKDKLVKRVSVDEYLFNRYVKEKKDLSTRWYRRIFANLFYPLGAGNSRVVEFVDTSGTTRTQAVKRNSIALSNYEYVAEYLWQSRYCHHRPWIAIGNGTTPPSIDDYTLESEIIEILASFDFNEENGILTLSASHTPTSNITVSEVGLKLECPVSSYNICGKILLDRTVLDMAINVNAGQTVTIAYKIAL